MPLETKHHKAISLAVILIQDNNFFIDNLNFQTMEKQNIEKALETSHTIHFFPTDNYDIEPSVITVEVHNFGLGGVAYDKLLDAFKNKNVGLTISDNKKTLNISLTDKITTDSINIEKLHFDRNQLENFLKKEPTNRKLFFILTKTETRGVSFLATRQPFSPLTLD